MTDSPPKDGSDFISAPQIRGKLQSYRKQLRLSKLPALPQRKAAGTWGIALIQTQLRGITEDINKHKKEVETLRTEKGTLEKVLSMNTENVRKTLTTEINRVEEEMKRNFAQQKAENNRLQQQIITLKTEKTHLQQELLALQRRIAELELQVGSEEKS